MFSLVLYCLSFQALFQWYSQSKLKYTQISLKHDHFGFSSSLLTNPLPSSQNPIPFAPPIPPVPSVWTVFMILINCKIQFTIMLRSILLASSRFSTEVQKASTKTTSSSGLTSYRDGQLVNRTALVLKKQEDIEAYVIKTVQNYFRTTYKQGVSKNSSLAEHGLDSLDAIEISMQIEEDLGYTISAETLPSFTKVKHYITYIEQVEAFKRENSKNPIA